MDQYISKDALKAEIKKLSQKAIELYGYSQFNTAYDNVLSILDTLEVEEVDLEKEIHSWMEDNTCRGYCSASIRDTAEYFFELSLKAQKGE